MDVSLALNILKVLPAVRDLAEVVFKRRGALKGAFQEQVRKMVKFAEDDISKLKGDLEEMKKTCAELNLNTGVPGSVPWQTPHTVNAYLAWRYRRVARKVQHLCEEFQTSTAGITDLIACCSGVMEKGSIDTQETFEEPTWSRDLVRYYQEVAEMVASPAKYSIDELSNTIEVFLDKSRFALQNVARHV